MSLLGQVSQTAGQGLIQGVSGWLGKVFGANNSTPLQDCQRAVGLYGQAGTLQRYPHCAGILGGQAGITTVPPTTVIPGVGAQVSPMVQSPLGGLPSAQTIAYTGGLTPLPTGALVNPATVAAASGAARALMPLATRGITSAVRASLPLMKRALAIASGFIVAGGLVYDVSGALIGKTRRRRRMNPLNYRAAKRAAHRLCAVQDLCGDIERALPRARAHHAAPHRRRRRRRCR